MQQRPHQLDPILDRRRSERLRSLILRRRLYHFMPPRLVARLLFTKPGEADVEWARQAMSNQWLAEQGLVSVRDLWVALHYWR